MPFDQCPMEDLSIVIRSTAANGALASAAREQVRAMDRDLPIYGLRTMEELISESVAQPRFYMLLLGSFAAAALVLAAIGIYAVVAHATAHRTTEIGVRLALGASAGRVVAQIVGESLRVIGIGMLAGWVLVFVVAIHAAPRGTLDAPLLLGVPALLLVVAALACWIPARRATRIDPMVALRHE